MNTSLAAAGRAGRRIHSWAIGHIYTEHGANRTLLLHVRSVLNHNHLLTCAVVLYCRLPHSACRLHAVAVAVAVAVGLLH